MLHSLSAMDAPDDYYLRRADEFFAATVGVDMSTLRWRFLSGLAPGARVLDAGCGSGRDARAFAEAGFAVRAVDASPALARLASAHSGLEVAVRRLEDLDEVAAYEAIWCCASLLHVPPRAPARDPS
jgi:2-polyprenyl-3-methyl-5-hydroxy-6-metoxy-1,4-benzoquinol methylase